MYRYAFVSFEKTTIMLRCHDSILKDKGNSIYEQVPG